MTVSQNRLSYIKYKTNFRKEVYPLRAHSHKEVSLGYIEKGSTEIKVLGQKFDLVAGDLVFIPSDTVHICTPYDPEAYVYHMFYFDRDWFDTNFPDLSGDFRTLAVPAAEKGSQLIQLLVNSRKEPDAIEIELRSFFSGLIEQYHLNDSLSGGQRYKLEAIHERIRQIPELKLSIETLADEVGINKSSFIRKYARLYGLTPHADIINQRIQRAILMMDDRKDLTAIALECGFADQSHFNRQFKLYSGMSPGEYRSTINNSDLVV